MHRFPLKPLSALICCALAGMATAEPSNLAYPPALGAIESAPPGIPAVAESVGAEEDGLSLTLSRRLSLLKDDGQEAYPVYISADHIEGRQDESTLAKGHVELRRIGQLLGADQLIYSPLEDQVVADGHIRFEQGTSIISGDHLELQVTDQLGYLDKPQYVLQRTAVPRGWSSTVGTPVVAGLVFDRPTKRPVTGYGEADRLTFEGQNQISLMNGTYSACKPDARDWYAKAEKLYLDFDTSQGKGEDVVLYFKDMPILYGPSLTFPLNDQRQSGVLPPIWGSSTRSGLDINLPLYWNIAPNYDATVTPRLLSKRGMQLGTNFRYMDAYSRGDINVEVLPHDREYGASRHALSILHNHTNLGQGFSGFINWNKVSDDTYWTDLSTRLVQTSQTHLPRQLTLNYDPSSWWSVNTTVLQYQTLQPDRNNPIARPYFMSPQVNFSGFLPGAYQSDVSLAGQYTAFTHPTQVQGQRFVAYPQWSMPLRTPAFYLTPKIGFHLSQYELNQVATGSPASISRSLPIFSLDSGVTFERDTQMLGKSYLQTLEPRLYYVNVPYRDQANIPIFDTGLADFNFAQIFSENRYVGHDRISDANQLTAAISTRLIDPNTGGDRIKFTFGQRYYFSDQRVTMPGETARNAGLSNLIAAFSGNLIPKVYLDMAVEYDQSRRTTQRSSLGVRYLPQPGKALSVSYRQTQGQLDQIDLAGQWPLSARWYAVGRYNYSFRDSRLVEGITGFEYKAGCWVSRFVAQRVQSASGFPITNFFYQLELNDFAQIGTNPVQLLRRSVPGYGRINDLGDPSDYGLITQE